MQKKWDIDDESASLCRNKESWLGSYYELSMAYSEAFNPDDQVRIMQWLWDDPSLLGVVRDHDDFGRPWQPIDASSLIVARHSYGCIRFPTGQIPGCGSQYTSLEGTRWLTLSIPLGMLDLILPVRYPVTRESNPWMTQLDTFLAMIGTRMYQAFPFLLAVMGEEATAFPLKSILATIGEESALLVPQITFRQLGVNPYGTRLAQDLWWTGQERKPDERTD